MPAHIREIPAKSGARWRRECRARARPLPRAAPSRGLQMKRAARLRRLPLRWHEPFHQRRQFLLRRCAQNFPLCAHSLRHAEAKSSGHQANRQRREPVVKPAAGLAANGNRVLESRCGYECHARARPLQHGVGSHGGAMANIELLSGSRSEPEHPSTASEGSAGVENSFRTWSSAIRQVNAIGKCAAGIDCYAQIGPLAY